MSVPFPFPPDQPQSGQVQTTLQQQPLSPEESLSDLINTIHFPPELSYDGDYGGGSSAVSTTAKQLITEDIVIKHDQELLRGTLQPLLSAYAGALASAPPEVRTSLRTLYGATATRVDREAHHGLSGEQGTKIFIKSYITDPINDILDRVPFDSLGYKLFWRIVGAGITAKPDLELVLQESGRFSPKVIAVVEVKTDLTINDRVMNNIISAYQGSAGIRILSGGTVTPSPVIALDMKAMNLILQASSEGFLRIPTGTD
ncbi:hypothetical protein IAU59_007578 [Kwoniella sp. CBS 9459]